MEIPSSPTLTFTSSSWPPRISGVSIFLILVGVYFSTPQFPVAVLGISFCFMIVAILFSAETLVVADNMSKTLSVKKKRIIAGSHIVYAYKDIAFIYKQISSLTDAQGKTSDTSSFFIGLNNEMGTTLGFMGRRPTPLPIPTSSLAVFSGTVKSFQQTANARILADFIGVPFYVQGTDHDTAINEMENVPGYVKDIGKITDALKKKDLF